MHPAQAEAWDWDEHNEDHLHAHRIMPAEVEELFYNNPVWAPNRSQRAGTWKMIGRTDSGRRLTVVVAIDSGRRWLRPITGWDSTKSDLSRYGAT